MRIFASMIILAFLPLVGCQPPELATPSRMPSEMPPPAPAQKMIELREIKERGVMEVVFRQQFEEVPSEIREKASFYFLSLAGKDPDDEFMKRFEGHDPPVKKESECVVSSEAGGPIQVTDKETGEEGLKFKVHSIEWMDPTRARVAASYYASGQTSSETLYRVVQSDDKWILQ